METFLYALDAAKLLFVFAKQFETLVFVDRAYCINIYIFWDGF